MIMNLSEKRRIAGRLGGLATSRKYGRDHYSRIGKIGGELGGFKKGDPRTKAAGRKGGTAKRGNSEV